MDAFTDPDIQGIWCIPGGYGCHRILPLLDKDLIRCNPKWFGGYSDVTALHTFFNQECHLESYHCIMPSTEPDADPFTLTWLKKALFADLSGKLDYPENSAPNTLVPGTAAGPLCGGNLSLVAASLGTPWEIDTRGKILFLEDIHEKTYRVDSMLTQLRNAGKFRDCVGIILGAWTDCEPEYPEKTLQLPEIFEELIAPAGKPTLTDLACGHTLPTLALPMGRMCQLDADHGIITLGGT
jgi:muramoyltetrapeptide carboxypeptidase